MGVCFISLAHEVDARESLILLVEEIASRNYLSLNRISVAKTTGDGGNRLSETITLYGYAVLLMAVCLRLVKIYRFNQFN